MAVVEIPALYRKVTGPVEDTYHIYPVLLIPTEKPGETLVIGRRKAKAIVKYHDDIKAFLDRHPE
jgi:hypothetical protein